MSESDAIKRILERERKARVEAERILEAKSLELYEANQELLTLNQELEQRVEIRAGLLRESEEMHRTLFEQHPLPLLIVRLDDGAILSVNRTAEDVYGYSKTNFQEKALADLGPFSMDDSLKELRVGATQDFSTEHTCADGTRLDVELRTRGLWYQSQRAAMILVLDVTERNRAIRAMAQSEEKYRGIIENLQLGMLETDLKGTIIKAYPKFCELVGYSPEELEGRDAKSILAFTEDLVKIQKKEKEREEGKASVYEMAIRHKNGERLWTMISGAPIFDADGRTAGSVGIHLDISPRKALEQELVQAKDVAEESVRVKEAFLANMSHEIRTPMNAIIGLGNLLTRTELDQEQSEYLSSIRTSAANLLHLINDLLDLSKIQAGKLEMNVAPFQLEELLDQVKKTLYYKAEDKGIMLHVMLGKDADTPLMGDAKRLNQVLLNLAGNAIKFTEEGHVAIHAKLINKAEGVGTVEFTVADTGIGIAPEKIESVFDQYAQADTSIEVHYGGTGLGLSICKEIVSTMGGEISAESDLGQGSTFRFSIPFPLATEQSSGTHKRHETIDGKPLEGVRILLTEDDPINQLVASKLLERWGADLEKAGHGGIALNKLGEASFDLILMDVQMPVLDGPSATRRIREELHMDIPIIALTANAIKGDRERFLAAGMNGYVSKPFDERELLEAILHLLEEHKNGQLAHTVPSPEEDVALHALQRLDESEDSASLSSENGGAQAADAGQVPQTDEQSTPHKNDEVEALQIQKLEELSGGDAVFSQDMLSLFREQAVLNLEGMREAIQKKDLSRLRFLGHRMKYQLDILGGPKSQELVRKLEHWEGPVEEAAAILQGLDVLVRHLVAEAENAMQRMVGGTPESS